MPDRTAVLGDVVTDNVDIVSFLANEKVPWLSLIHEIEGQEGVAGSLYGSVGTLVGFPMPLKRCSAGVRRPHHAGTLLPLLSLSNRPHRTGKKHSTPRCRLYVYGCLSEIKTCSSDKAEDIPNSLFGSCRL